MAGSGEGGALECHRGVSLKTCTSEGRCRLKDYLRRLCCPLSKGEEDVVSSGRLGEQQRRDALRRTREERAIADDLFFLRILNPVASRIDQEICLMYGIHASE